MSSFIRGYKHNDVITGPHSLETLFYSVPTEHMCGVISFLAVSMDFTKDSTKEQDKSKELQIAAGTGTPGGKREG